MGAPVLAPPRRCWPGVTAARCGSGCWPRSLLLVVGVIITLAVNVPLNDAIKAAGDPDRIADLGAVRRAFDESRWATAGTSCAP